MARPLQGVPTFGAGSLLCRYVDSDGGRRRRATYADFMPNPGDDHLSVNSLEVETKRMIALYYAAAFQANLRPVGICTRPVRKYNEVAKKSQCTIAFNTTGRLWEFTDRDGKSAQAYKHRPVRATHTYPFSSESHCGVEFVRAFEELQLRHFARRLANVTKIERV
jgi:hypothetical protein